VLGDLSRACTACAPSPPTTASATTSSSTATSSATTGRQQLHRPDQRDLRPGHPAARLPRPGRAAGDRRQHGRPPRAQLGALVAFFLYLNRFFAPIQLLVQQYNTFQQGQSSIVKLRTLFAVEPSTPEAADASELPPIEGEIVFDHVTFGYDPATPVIRDVDLRIRAGETVAFVGQTGAGKSTLAKLITRFYDPTEGGS
jgi:ABC-type multidrug transport system fused ATPase/permease subunit